LWEEIHGRNSGLELSAHDARPPPMPYCLAAEELGSSGLPDSVYPSPDAATARGRGLPRTQGPAACCSTLAAQLQPRVA
jgi:hypothetical protein